MSNIASLEAELDRQRSINRELSSELNTISYGLSRAHNRIENFNSRVCSALESSRAFLDDSQNKMQASLETQEQIEHLYVRFKAMELANKRIRDCNNKKFYDFANYAKVRKLVQGIMDNLDVHMASDRVIYKSVEHAHLQTPDYWLTCVLLSIMAWRDDDRDLADRAMDLALGLDRKSSTLFYMLFNLRMKREDAAMKWFQEYQTCERKGSDQRSFLLLFALVSRCINAEEELSPESRETIASFLRQVRDESEKRSGYNRQAMVERAQAHMAAFDSTEQVDYPLLRKYSTEFTKYTQVLSQARGNEGLLEYFRELLCVGPEQRNAFIKSFIDELIAAANSQEKGVYEEIAYNETIIRMEGDVDAAKEIFGKQKIHDEQEINLIYEMIEWVYGEDWDDVNDQSRLRMFLLTREIQHEALQARAEGYRSVDIRHCDVTMGSYSTKMDLKDPSGEKQKAEIFYAGERDRELAAISDVPAFVGFGVAAAGVAAAVALSMGWLTVTALGAGFGIVKLMLNKSARHQAELNYQDACRLSGQAIEDLCREFGEYEAELAHYDAYTEAIAEAFDKASG